MSDTVTTEFTQQLVNVQEFTGEWKITLGDLSNAKCIETPTFSPLYNIPLKFHFKISAQLIRVRNSLENVSLFQFDVVKQSFCEVPSSLKMKIKVALNYHTGSLFTEYQFPAPVSVTDIDVYNFPDITSQLYDKQSNITEHYLRISSTLSLKCEMTFFDEIGSLPVRSQDTRFSKNFEKVTNNFSAAYNSRELADVKFNIGDKSLYANKFILTVHSPVFKKMFTQKCVESATQCVTLTDATFEAFDSFLKYLYCGKIEDESFDNVRELYVLGDKYDVQALKEYCVEIMTSDMSVDRVCEILKIACQYDDEDLEKSVKAYVSEHWSDMISDAKWDDFIAEFPRMGYNMAINVIQQRIKKL